MLYAAVATPTAAPTTFATSVTPLSLLTCVSLFRIISPASSGKILNRVWWTPMNVKRFMEKQGIKRPSYKFIHGNKKEISKMIQDSIAQPMDISHHIFPRLQPHIYAWIKIYGMSFIHWNGPTAELLVTEP